ncbi:cytochrome C oxidase subunit IV family protein [Pseudoalteromonas denitrificans]|uniref:Cytochrome C oxidase subunit IV n=1 Tax=Pseudoalteromonas denitrificans DSM 6059 TaxID=1123010 RepID=A0A1I1FP19_9GAMM|nr:cytochrome C oxidase subunit IV family protein [Pseudoalteromonas denitrificans]SFC01299.1 Cytochrome C oxidase subunit IV [Pseudoalteromonas denitrificans DSM 6059]
MTKMNATISLIVLMSLTLTSVFIGFFMSDGILLNNGLEIWLILITIIIKGQQIVDIFMELKCAPRLWRALLLSYVIIIPIIIGLIYWV